LVSVLLASLLESHARGVASSLLCVSPRAARLTASAAFCGGDGFRGRFGGSVPSPVVVQSRWHERDRELQSLSEDFVAKPVGLPNP